MRVSAQRNNGKAPYAIPFSAFLTYTDEDGERLLFEDTLSDDLVPQQKANNVSATFGSKIWGSILPGLERGSIVLRSQEYSHAEIGWIFGMKTDEVSRILYKVKNRLVKLGIAQTPDMFI